MKKICWQITVAAFMQPLQYDLRSPAAKDNSITHAAKAGSNLAIPFTLREGSYSCKSQWNSIGNSSTSTTCNPIYIAGTILQLQITMEFCRPHMHEKQLTPHLQCGTDPRMIRDRSEHDPTTHETVSHPSHRRGRSSRFGDTLCMEKHRVSCSTKNSWHPIYNAEPIREWSETDPRPIRAWSDHTRDRLAPVAPQR